jgi:hypothetical protein
LWNKTNSNSSQADKNLFKGFLFETVSSCQMASKSRILGPTWVNSKQRTYLD